jgi:hypothetical protein
MTRVIVIDPKARTATARKVDETKGLLHEGIITPGEGGVDHSALAHPLGLGIIVNGFGLVGEGKDDEYFSLGDQLFNGVSVVYAYDSRGDTVDVAPVAIRLITNNVRWFDDRDDVERSIAAGWVVRPQASITKDGVKTVYWRWPEPRKAAPL